MASITYVAFNPSPTAAPPFTTNVVLDGSSYTLAAAWNFYRGGWYISLTDQSGDLVVNQPLVGSPPDADIPLAPGMFTSSKLVYRVSTNNFEIFTT